MSDCAKFDVHEIANRIAAELPVLHGEIAEEAKARRGYFNLQAAVSDLADDLFAALGPQSSAELVYWVANILEDRAELAEDLGGRMAWSQVQDIANTRTCLGSNPLPLLEGGDA